jgi:hypothetical protein
MITFKELFYSIISGILALLLIQNIASGLLINQATLYVGDKILINTARIIADQDVDKKTFDEEFIKTIRPADWKFWKGSYPCKVTFKAKNIPSSTSLYLAFSGPALVLAPKNKKAIWIKHVPEVYGVKQKAEYRLIEKGDLTDKDNIELFIRNKRAVLLEQ